MARRFWPFGRTENRAYSDTVTEALLNAASGEGLAPQAEAIGAVEAAAGLWSRAFASASVTPSSAATRALTPSVMASIGRGLAIRGDVLLSIDVMDGMDGMALTQASHWKVRGGTRPESWTYLAEFPTPGGVRKRTLPAESVIHLRYATRPAKPWAGVSPLGMARETRALAGWIEKRLAQETSATTGYVVTVPDGASDGNVTNLANELKALAGRLFVAETTSHGWGAGQQAAPRRADYETVRLGANPPDSLGKLRSDVKADIFGAYGIPSSVHGTGGSARESYRQFLSSTIQPLSKLVLQELSEKLDTSNLAFDFTEMRAADIASRARAYSQLVGAGMDAAKASQVTGLD